MPMPWFRVYSEIKDDPKILELDDHQRWLWICLLALASESMVRGVIENVRPKGLAAALRTDETRLVETLRVLEELEMVEYDTTEGFVRIVHWDDRQYDKPSNRPPLREWRILRAIVFSRDDYTCQYCGSRGCRLECDHIIPSSRGGSNDLENLATACFACNHSKWAKTPQEWRR